MHVILTSSLYLPNIGGIENSLRSLSEVGASRGDNIIIVSSNIVDGGENLPAGEIYDNGLKLIRYKSESGYANKIIDKLYHFFSAVRCYNSLRNKTEYTVIARYHWNVIYAWLAGFRHIKYLVPGVVEFQNSKNNTSGFRRISFHIEVFVQKIAFKLSRNYVFSSNMIEQIKFQSEKASISKVNPGVDGERFSLKRINATNEINLIMVCRFVKVKGIDFAVKALCHLPEEYTLTIVGDGPCKQEIIDLVIELGLNERVAILNRTQTPEVYYSNSDIFLLPSTYEPFGQTLLEASASGLATVCFDSSICQTASNDILGEFGFYCLKLDEKAYANKIVDAAQYIKEKADYSMNLRKFILTKYSWEKLYLDLMEGVHE